MNIDAGLKKELSKWGIASVNNLVFFLLTFLVAYLVHNLALSFVSYYIGIKINFHNFTVSFNAQAASIPSIILLFSSGPVALLVLSFFSYGMFRRYKRKKGYMKILFLWSFLNSFNMLFAYLVIGFLTESGFGEILWRLHVSDLMKILLIFLFSLIIVLVGNSNSKYFYTTTFSKSFTESRRKRLMFLIISVLIPVLVGFGLFTAINYSSNSFYQQAVLVFFILILIPAFKDKQAYNHIRLIRETSKPSFAWAWIIILGSLIIFLRFLIGLGVF